MPWSKTQHGDLPFGLALAGLLGLSGVVLLSLGRPIATPFHPHARVADDVEVRQAARDAPIALPAPAAAPYARRIVATPAPLVIKPSSPALPAETETQALPEPTPPPASLQRGLVLDLGASSLACLGDRESLLSSLQRDHCREALGALARYAPPEPSTIDPEKRASYDAAARGAGGAFAADDRPRASKSPRVGCALKFGPHADNGPGAAPCFIRTPGG